MILQTHHGKPIKGLNAAENDFKNTRKHVPHKRAKRKRWPKQCGHLLAASKKNDRFMPQKLLIRRGARLHLPIVTCFCSRCCCCCFRCCCRCWQLGSVFSRQIDMPPADVSQTRTETNGHGRGCGRTRTDTGGQRRPDGRTAGQRVKSGWQTCIHQEKRLQ